MSNARDIIVRPLVTEKTIRSQEGGNTVVFEVRKGTNKIQIKQAIEEIFNVKVANVISRKLMSSSKMVTRSISSRINNRSTYRKKNAISG